MSSDVKSKRITATGSLSVGPARIRQIHILTSSSAGRLTITDGSGGETVLDIDTQQSTSGSINVPSDGIKVGDIHVSAVTNITAATIFYN